MLVCVLCAGGALTIRFDTAALSCLLPVVLAECCAGGDEAFIGARGISHLLLLKVTGPSAHCV